MGWAEQLPSGRWRAMIRVGSQQRNATPGKTYSSRAEARRIAGKGEDEQRLPGAHDPRAARMTWGQWAPTWWDTRDVAPRTRTGDRSHVNVHISPAWSATPLGNISRDGVQRWVRDLERSGMAPAHVIRVFHTFSGSLHAAVLAGRLAANPCHGVKLPRIPQRDERYLTHAEVEAIAFHMDQPYRRIVFVLCGTGLRWGELAALHWHRVNTDQLHVSLAWDSKNHRYGVPKDRERRDVPLLDFVAEELDAHRGTPVPRGRCSVEHPAVLGQRCRSPLVFPDARGGPLHHAAFLWHWRRVVGGWQWHDSAGKGYPTQKAAQAMDPRGAERLWVPGTAGITDPARIHDMRHTFASWFLHAGGTLPELASIMGHHSVVVTERYAHLAPDRHEATRTRMAGMGPRTQVAPHSLHADASEESNVASLLDRRRSAGA